MPVMSRALADVTRRMCAYCRASASRQLGGLNIAERATVPADFNNAVASGRTIRAALAPRRLRNQRSAEQAEEEEEGGREGRPRIHENSAAHTLASAAKS